jgi:hypothetical protein
MEWSNMKRFLSIVLFTVIFASPTLAQNTTSGGGPELTVHSSKGTRVLKDTTQHTTLSDGTVVSTSKGKDGQPNGGAGNGGDTSHGSGGASYEGD